MRKSLVLAIALVLGGCSPSINPQMKAATDGLAATFAAQSRSQAAPAAYDPTPWAVGQSIVQRMTDEKGNVSIMRMSVVGEEGGGIWLENEHQDYFHHTITKILYSRMPRTADEIGDVLLKVVTKTDDKPVQTIDFAASPLGGLQKSMFKSVAANMVVTADVAQAAKEDVTVPAGTFQGCAKFNSQVSFGGVTQKSTSWFHPGVPINGAVKGAAEDGKWKLELLDFGTTGATSKL